MFLENVLKFEKICNLWEKMVNMLKSLGLKKGQDPLGKMEKFLESLDQGLNVVHTLVLIQKIPETLE